MEAQQIKPGIKDIFNSELFKEMENKVICEAVSEASKTARRELELFKFELAYPMIVSKQEQDEIEKFIDDSRRKKWQTALEKAGGDEEKALMLV